jgi:hypothetical protein
MSLAFLDAMTGIIKQIINVEFQFHIIGKKITEVAFAQINRVMKIQMIIPEV